MEYKAAIFDMDGTLIDSVGVLETIYEKTGEKYLNVKNFRPSAEDDKIIRTLLLKDAAYHIHKEYGVAETGDDLFEYFKELLRWFYKDVVCLKDGVKEYLDYLKGNNVKMCVATATSKELSELALNRCGIREYFLDVISCVDIGKGKEYPDIYLAAAKLLGIFAEDGCVVDDSLTAIKTATKVGFKTIGIYDSNNCGQEELSQIATEYIAKGESLKKLIKK